VYCASASWMFSLTWALLIDETPAENSITRSTRGGMVVVVG